MKPRKHKRKESFSVLLISNTGHNSRQYHITKSCMRLAAVFVCLVCITFGWFSYRYLTGQENVSMAAGDKNDEEQTELMMQLASQQETIRQLEEEKADLTNQNNALTSENKALLEAARSNMSTGETEVAIEPESDTAFPSRYPYSEPGIVSTKYSQEHPYVSIETQDEGNIIAAGEGTITAIDSDAEHPLIIEIEHGNGYKTRYMFVQDAEPVHEEGDKVQSGDVLAAVNAENEQVDYQVIFEDEPIDPLIVFEAKG